MNNIQSL